MSKKPDMLEYLNTHDKDDIYCRVLTYILSHQSDIPNKSITSIASGAFVSPSTISRTIQKFGFIDLKEFKSNIEHLLRINPDYVFRLNKTADNLLKEKPSDFLNYYQSKISKSLIDVSQNLDTIKVDMLLNSIKSHTNIYIFVASESKFLASELQHSLFTSQKLINIWDITRADETVFNYLNKNSVAIIISSFGNFLNDQPNLINNIIATKCQTFLITQHTYNMQSLTFDHIINVTSENHVQAGIYPLFFFCEFLGRRYYTKFSK